MTCRARADRWVEEVELLQEEMRRVIVYLEWKAGEWSKKVGIRVDSCTPDIQHGVDAYARKQANIHHEIAISFASQWLPYLHACCLETGWAAQFPWTSEILSRKAKLPRWFQTNSQDTPHAPPPTGSSPCATEGLGIAPEYLGSQKTQIEGDSYKGEAEHAESPIDINNEGSGDEEEQSPGSGGAGYYDEGSDDEGEDNESCDDDTGANDGFGFEYNDEYMS